MPRFVLRGARVVDGTGAAERRADVVVADGHDRVGRRRPASTNDGPSVDLDGLVLAPGFIDPHTHYDAQLLWDADAHAVVVARGHHGRHRQLRLRHRADPARAPVDDDAGARERRGHAATTRWSRASPGPSRPSPSTSTRSRRRPLRLNVGAAARSHAAAVLRDGRRRDRAGGHRPTSWPRCGRSSTRALEAGAIGFSTSRSLEPRRRVRPSGAEPGRQPRRARRAHRADARARHRLLRGDVGSRLPRRRGGDAGQAHRPAGVVGGDHGQQAPAGRGGRAPPNGCSSRAARCARRSPAGRSSCRSR